MHSTQAHCTHIIIVLDLLFKMKVTETFLLILVAFFVVNVTAKETPKFAEDFTAHMKVELHTDNGELEFGEGLIVRDGKDRSFQRSVLDSQMNFRLDRYDLKTGPMEYYFRGNKSEFHCSRIATNETKLFSFWGWLSDATFIGTKEFEHRKMEVYESEVVGVRITLGVDPDNSTNPLLLERRSEFQQVIFNFNDFSKYDDKRDGKMFDVPDQCKPSV